MYFYRPLQLPGSFHRRKRNLTLRTGDVSDAAAGEQNKPDAVVLAGFALEITLKFPFDDDQDQRSSHFYNYYFLLIRRTRRDKEMELVISNTSFFILCCR